jgi:hypothetical protein
LVAASSSQRMHEPPATRTVRPKIGLLEPIVAPKCFVNWLTCAGHWLPYIDGLTARFVPRSAVVNGQRTFEQQV